MAVFPVVVDACVLFNAPVRDLLLRAAEYGLFRIHWSQKILDETTKNIMETGRMNQGQAEHLVEEMSKAFPEAMTGAPDDLIAAMKNDPKDKHIVAAAVTCSAQVIITFNVEDFKSEHIGHLNIEAQHPDVFLLYLFGLQPSLLVTILMEQAGDLRNVSLNQLLDRLEKHVPLFVAAARTRIASW